MIRSLLTSLCLGGLATAEISAVPDPHCKFNTEDTVVWSPLFIATWLHSNSNLGGQPVKLESENELMSRLDAFKLEPKTIFPEGRWKTWAGPASRDFLAKVNKEAAAITGEASGPYRIPDLLPIDTHVAFGLLDRKVDFEKPFFRSVYQPLIFGKNQEPVEFFGVQDEESEDFRKHVRVLAYRPLDGSHCIEVACKNADDKLILYRPAKPVNFATACRWIKQWREEHDKNASEVHGNWNDGFLHSGDVVKIPYITLENTSDFADQLQTPRYFEGIPVPNTIFMAQQKTLFKLTEKGAEARVEVTILGAFGGGPEPIPPTPRDFIYNQPFFAFLWRENADLPYIGVWLGDASALHPKK